MAQPRSNWVTVEDFSAGFRSKRDITQLPAGALIPGSQNVRITDGDRVGNRRGSQLLGVKGTQGPIQSLHTFKKRSGLNIMIRSYDEVLEYYHPGTAAWENLNDGYTSKQVFGFADHNVNTEAIDATYFCNAIEPYSRWTGVYTQLDGALSGGEATITVDSVLEDQVFVSDTASSVTTTTLIKSTSAKAWGGSIWNDFYVLITSGAQAGSISKITATTPTQITFDAITGLSGTPTYEIRRAAFTETGTLRIGTSDVTYTGLGSSTTFTGCSGAPAASDDAAVAQAVQEYPRNPKGNILLVHNTRMFVSGVKENPQATYYSVIADATDFTFSSPRVADDGGIVDTPEGGGAVTALGLQQETIYLMKEDIIKTLTFTQDGNDLPQIFPLIEAPEVGALTSKGAFKIDNEQFYVAKDGGIKSVAQVANVNYVQALQLSDPIVRYVNTLDFTDAAAIFYKQKAYIAAKSSGASQNDVILPYNSQKQTWEAPILGWSANAFTIYNGELYAGSSTTNEVVKIEAGGTYDDQLNPYVSIARFAYNNYGSPEFVKQFQNFFLEGYISENTTITIRLLYNYLGKTEIKEMELSGSDSQYILEPSIYNLLGNAPLGVNTLAGVFDPSPSEGLRDLAKFRVYFPLPITPFYELSVEVSSNKAGDLWEVLRFGTDAVVRPEEQTNLKKSLT